MKEKKLGKVFLGLTMIAAVFSSVSLWISDTMICTLIGFVFFIVSAFVTLRIDKKYKESIIKLLDIF